MSGTATATGATAAPTTPPATAGTTTSYIPSTDGGGATYPTIPAPASSCSTDSATHTALPGQTTLPTGVLGASGGGGATPDMSGVLTQLSAVIGPLQTVVGGVAGGGAAGAPGQTPTQTPAQAAPTQVAGAAGAGPAPGKPGQVAGASGGGAMTADCGMDHTGAGATAPAGPSPSSVAGANGAGAANAAQGAQVAQGGGPTGDMTAVLAALQGVVQALTQLVASMGGSVGGVNGGGPGGKPGQSPLQVAPSDVDGATGPGGKVGQVGGEAGPGGKVGQVAGEYGPDIVLPVAPGKVDGEAGPGGKPGDVAGDSGPGLIYPPYAPPVAPAPPTQQGPDAGPPAVKDPSQFPGQTPGQVGGVNGGGVILDNVDGRQSAKLTSDTGNSVELWGDPHVVLNFGGVEETFDIGYGAFSIPLSSGAVVSWDTYEPGTENEFVLRNFRVDTAGTQYDQDVTTGDAADELGLQTALTDADLQELAGHLRALEGPMNMPIAPAGSGPVVQAPPKELPVITPVVQGEVAGADGGPSAGKTVDQTAVAAAAGAPTKPADQPVVQTAVATAKGAPTGKADDAPLQAEIAPPTAGDVITPVKTDTAGANGAGAPGQAPTQMPTQAPTQAAEGSVILDNVDSRYSAKLTSTDGKVSNSVELWGDPHVVTNIDGVEQKFDIGYGAGSITLASGNVVSWDTYEPGHERQFILNGFAIDSLGTNLDRSVNTADGQDQLGITTALSDADVRELASQLALYQGSMSDPLTLATTPAQGDPAQV